MISVVNNVDDIIRQVSRSTQGYHTVPFSVATLFSFSVWLLPFDPAPFSPTMSSSPPPAGGPLGPGRCGMCGSCGSMPPWAPEALKDASPAARRALFERMQEKQRHFIVERDARLTAMKLSGSSGAQDNVDREPNADEPEQSEAKGDIPLRNADANNTQLPPADDIPLQIEKASTEGGSPLAIHDDLSGACNALRVAPVAVASPRAPVSPPASAADVASSPKRKPSRHAVVIDPDPVRTAQRASNPNMSSASLRSNDSDADSFYTAEEVDHPAREPDTVDVDEMKVDDDGLEEVPMGDDGEEKDDDFADWQAFHSDKPNGTDVRGETETESEMAEDHRCGTVEQGGEETTVVPLDDDTEIGSLQPDADEQNNPIPTLSMLQLSSGKSLMSVPSDNLEETVSARRSLARGHSRQGSASHFEEYALPSDLVPLRSADVAPQLQCHDCEKWRGRVEELQLKVEALTSALAARDMESAALRAKSTVKTRAPNRNESRLIQECESLRVTTEFLYQKLERYERRAHVGDGDIH